MIGLFNHGTQGTATGSQLSFVPQGRLKSPGRGGNPYFGAPPTTGLLILSSPQSKDSTSGRQRIIYNGPPSRPHLVAFYDMLCEEGSYYQDPPQVPFYVDLFPEAGYTTGTGSYWGIEFISIFFYSTTQKNISVKRKVHHLGCYSSAISCVCIL